MKLKRLQKQFPGLETEEQAQALAAVLRRERGGIALSLSGIPLLVALFCCVGWVRWSLLAAGLLLFIMGSVLLNKGRTSRAEQWEPFRYRIKEGKKCLALVIFRRACQKWGAVGCSGWTMLMVPGVVVALRKEMPKEVFSAVVVLWLAGLVCIGLWLWVMLKRLPRIASVRQETVVRKAAVDGKSGRVYWLHFENGQKKSVSEQEWNRCAEGESAYLLLFVGKRFADALPADAWTAEQF